MRKLKRPNTLGTVSFGCPLLTLCSCLMLVFLAGCSQPPNPSNKIVLWHWMTDRNDTFQKLAQQYKQATGIEVSIQLFAPSDSYSQKVIAAEYFIWLLLQT